MRDWESDDEKIPARWSWLEAALVAAMVAAGYVSFGWQALKALIATFN